MGDVESENTLKNLTTELSTARSHFQGYPSQVLDETRLNAEGKPRNS